ncbi:PASTA domain-containing protein [Rhodocaloribacter litoris]|uniref:PASTA domain-containing protein n=1 Tax=Rhodocaloribacter litoris TaxID=2558931 RepID=UPI0014237B5F|nr:PASTA domain-containing protein [Rhodocaloribacter litoris]QXD13903.1 PASTA domain-containing protein [Rhodocaloribacter litoris]
MKIPPALRRTGQFARDLFTNPYFLGGLAGLILTGGLVYLLVDAWLMPAYTRQDVAVVVPDVRYYPVDEAERILARHELQVEHEVQRFNPNVEPDVVVDQQPPPNTPVKPGRRVYLTINSGTVPTVQVPGVEGLSLREARNRMMAAGLPVKEVRPDSIPSPAPNTVTRQQPPPGELVPQGTGVILWYSTGLGQAYVAVPDVTGQTIEEARQHLLAYRLRSVVLGTTDSTGVLVEKQSPAPGTRVREGFEVRLFVQEE